MKSENKTPGSKTTKVKKPTKKQIADAIKRKKEEREAFINSVIEAESSRKESIKEAKPGTVTMSKLRNESVRAKKMLSLIREYKKIDDAIEDQVALERTYAHFRSMIELYSKSMEDAQEEEKYRKEYNTQFRCYSRVLNYCDANDRTIEEEYALVRAKTSTLSRAERNYVIGHVIQMKQQEAKLAMQMAMEEDKKESKDEVQD